jgi:glucose dehydrogenase
VDYDLWRGTFGSATNLAADGNGNGEVDAADYTTWRDHLGQMVGADSQSAAVPEPAPIVLMILAAASACTRRIQRHCWSQTLFTPKSV